ncbi:MAG: ATP-binding protein [Candidatus Aminicenantes bacterium]|nr:ATP-binding protein [Candidatus Aminicenantes bacterium]
MLGLRQKITLGFSGLLIITLVIGVQGILNITRLGGSVDVILRENYRSVIACQRMKEALERIDSGLLFTLIGEADRGAALIRKNEAAFEEALRVELDTITLPGEGEKASRLRGLFSRYRAEIGTVENSAGPIVSRREAYFSTLFPLFDEIKGTADDILRMNQQNMSDANDRARRTAAQARKHMYILLLAGTAAAAAFIIFSRKWVMRPIRRLIRSTEEIRRGNLDFVVSSQSWDEIGQLSESFNIMAASLREFRRTDQAKLLRIQRATQQAFDSLPDAVAIVDAERRIEVATEAAKIIFFMKPGAVLSELPFSWMTELFDQAVRTGRKAVLEGGNVIQQFIRGEEKYFRPEALPIFDNDHLTNGAIMMLKDVTLLRQHDEIKKGVIRTVSHQLKTPLTSIRMAIHLLLEERVGTLTEKQAELLVAAREESERLHEILNNLLDISRLEAGRAHLELQKASPSSIVLGALDPHRRTAQDRGISLRTDIAVDLPDVLVDRTRIDHVFGNLLSNAFKHTPPGGRVTISVSAAEAEVQFRVSDTGEGIPAPFLPRLFEPFFRIPGRENETGAGLGLAIAKEIVEAQGGSIAVESREGEGSTFTFTLRRADRFSKEVDPS